MKKADIKVVIGQSGSGKTVLVNHLTQEAGRVLFFDTLGHDYNSGIVFEKLNDLKRFWLGVYQNHFRLIYRPFAEMPEFNSVCELVYQCGNMTLVAEEMDLYYPPLGTSTQAKTILRRGRHSGVHFIGVSQRPQGIDKNIMALATEVFVFETHEPRDVKYLADRFGESIVDLLNQLQPYEYVRCWNGKKDKEIGKVNLSQLA